MVSERKWSLTQLISGTFAIIALISITLISCSSDPDETTLDLNFTLTYDDEPLFGFNEVTYPMGYEMFFTKYSFFLSDIKLHQGEESYTLSNVEFIDLLTDLNDEASAIEGISRTYANVPTGE